MRAAATLDAVDLQGEHSDVAALGARLHHRLAAVVAGNQQIIVATEHHVDRVHSPQQLQVRAEPHMGQCDDDIGTVRLQEFGEAGARLRHGCEGHVRAGIRNDGSLWRDQAEEADAVAVLLHHRSGRGAGEAPARDAHVAGKPDRFRLHEPLLQHVRAEVEFVVADDRDVEADGVGEIDHVRALVDPGEHGGRNHVAAVGDHRQAAFGVRPRAFLSNGGGDSCGTARALDARHLVPIVHVN